METKNFTKLNRSQIEDIARCDARGERTSWVCPLSEGNVQRLEWYQAAYAQEKDYMRAVAELELKAFAALCDELRKNI